MRMPRDRIFPVFVALFLLAGCSGDRKAPAPAPPPPVENVTSPASQQGGGSPVGGGSAETPVVAVRNSPPEIRGVRFVGGDGRPGNTLGVEVEGYDADGDAVQFEIAWRGTGNPRAPGTA